jgi:O-antigen ligase
MDHRFFGLIKWSHALVGFMAFLGSCVVFMPVGMGYLAMLLLLIAFLVDRCSFGVRWERLRQHPVWWPIVAFIGWSVVVMVFQERWFAETPSNLFHIIRIALTLMFAVMLSRDELIWALWGLAVAYLWAAGLLLLHAVIGLPLWSAWRDLLFYSSNKSISDAILIAIAAGLAVLSVNPREIKSALVTCAVALLCLLVQGIFLPNRTAQLALLIGLFFAWVHAFRSHLCLLALLGLGLVGVFCVVVWGIPSLHDRFALGFSELQAATSGVPVTGDPGSWGIRVIMYETTYQMILDSPWLGNGIGAWNVLWVQRVPAMFAGFNMPHNDYLWMGAQAGWPGLCVFGSLLMTGLRQGWRRSDQAGRALLFVTAVVCVAAMFNTATRDAQIGLPLLWVLGLFLNLGQQPLGFLNEFSTSRFIGHCSILVPKQV